jgi:hypothetical protein
MAVVNGQLTLCNIHFFVLIYLCFRENTGYVTFLLKYLAELKKIFASFLREILQHLVTTNILLYFGIRVVPSP